MGLHLLPQDYISNGMEAETKLFKLEQIDAINVKKRSRHDSCAKPMNPKGEILGTCGLEGIKGSPAEPPEVDLEFDIWLEVLNFTSWVQISVALLGFILNTRLNPIG